ncbi:MAG: 6-phosphogluconolactonase [Solirubrobacterales bacterium]|nr:6-phosphogluconolactonase [Solirubrobacterales bacterium]OJU94599.1 MAG: 6-phosphogluconolactonase [Solirubrobacterales bacterium 67-14]
MVSRVVADAEAAAIEAARIVEMVADAAIADRGRFNFAVSGGKTPWRMLELLAESSLNWSRTSLFQVDERIAPTGSTQRNLTHLVLTLPLICQAAIRPMPVGADDLATAASGYEYSLPDRFDLVHLGLGPDGHTASLIPDDQILEVTDRQVAITAGDYQGTRRMSLTYKAIDRARQILFLVTGEGKEEALSKLTAGDPSIPAGRIENPNVTLVTDIELSETADAT